MFETDATDYYETLPTPPEGITASTDIIARRIYTRRDAALFSINACTDAGRNLYWGCYELIGNSTRWLSWVQDEYGGTQAQLPTVILPGRDKGNDVRMLIGGPDGRSLIVMWTAHEAITGERDNSVLYAEIPGVVRVPYPQGTIPEGGAFDGRTLGSPAPNPSPTPSDPIDYDRLNSMIVGGIRGLISEFGGHPMGVRAGIQEKVEDALLWLLTVTEENAGGRWAVATAYRDALFTFHRNLEGAQLWEGFIRSHLVPPALAPEWVHGLDGYPWGVV